MVRMRALVVIGCCLVFLPAMAVAQKEAKLTAVSIRYPGALHTVAYGANKDVHIVGEFQAPDESWHGFIKIGGKYHLLEPNGIPVTPYGINMHGEIVGQHYINDMTGTQSFRLSPDDVYTPADFPGAEYDILMKVNNLGDACGSFLLEGFGNSVGWLLSGGQSSAVWMEGDGVDIFPQDLWCEDLNNNGVLAGNIFNADGRLIGWTLAEGVFTLYEFPGATVTIIRGNNDHGHLVGEYHDAAANRWRGFRWKNGEWVTLNIQKDAETHPYDITNGGHIVGFYTRPGDGYRLHGFRAKVK